jgi:transcriptional regulator with GAF, ATPase, and Fis domain
VARGRKPRERNGEITHEHDALVHQARCTARLADTLHHRCARPPQHRAYRAPSISPCVETHSEAHDMTDKRERELIGNSQQMKTLQTQVRRVAASDAKVLITGESGVGKELVARALHTQGSRAAQRFVPVNCAGLPETLLESELFGHVKGSFTGAFRDQAGKLELAHLGTVFLDELGEMTPRMQSLLLRFLETGELQKVGADQIGQKVDVRVIAATNRDLQAMVRQGTFREDLFYRIRVIHLRVPPLRERPQDIPDLVEHFLARFTEGTSLITRGISPAALERFVRHQWPGNVRELENVLERLVVTGQNPMIELDDLPPELLTQHQPPDVTAHAQTVADELYRRLTQEGKCFWTTVYPLYMQREITRGNVRELVRKALEETRGSYRVVTRMFNMEDADYKRFLNFLRKHDCQIPYRSYRLQSLQ